MEITEKQKFIEKITEELAPYEKERKKRLFVFILVQLLKISLIVTFLIFLYLYCKSSRFVLPIVLFAIITLIPYIFNDFRAADDKFKKYLKKNCHYKKITNALNLKLLKRGKISKDILEDTKLFPEFTRQNTDDVITGCYKGVEFMLTESELIRVTRGDDGECTEKVVFKGVIISFPSNKKIEAQTVITPKCNIKQSIGKVTSWLGKMSEVFVSVFTFIVFWVGLFFLEEDFTIKIMFGVILFISTLAVLTWFRERAEKKKKYEIKEIKYQKINLEDADFEKIYNVSSKNQVEARYLLTTSFMARLKLLETAYGKRVSCSFMDEYIIFAIPTMRNLFELGSLYKSLKSSDAAETFYNEIVSVLNMIDHFKLGEKTGL